MIKLKSLNKNYGLQTMFLLNKYKLQLIISLTSRNNHKNPKTHQLSKIIQQVPIMMLNHHTNNAVFNGNKRGKNFHIQERKKHINDLDFCHLGHFQDFSGPTDPLSMVNNIQERNLKNPMSQFCDLSIYYKDPGEVWIIPELFFKINV